MTFSKERAEKLSTEIILQIFQLSFFPYMYQIFYKDYRAFTIKNKRVIYYIDEEKKKIIIYRILGGYQNYEFVL